MTDAVIVLNAGSTSLKFCAYSVDARELPLLCRGQIDSMQGDPHFLAKDKAGKALDAHDWGKGQTIDHKTAVQFVITWMESRIAGMKIVAAGHRIVLGGARFAAPVLIEGDVLDYLESLTTMEPSHQAYNVLGARAIAAAFPGLPQVACFDSSFHRTMPSVAQNYALPLDARNAGARHWGVSRHLLRLHQPSIAEICAACETGGRRPSRRRRQHVRHARWAQRRDHDGLCRVIGATYGHALGRCSH
jgi:acetate kinase